MIIDSSQVVLLAHDDVLDICERAVTYLFSFEVMSIWKLPLFQSAYESNMEFILSCQDYKSYGQRCPCCFSFN